MLPYLEFERLVEDALTDLPDYFQEKMNNVAVLIRVWPLPTDLAAAGVPAGHTLLGLYHGIPLPGRTHNYNLVSPDTITLFQGPIERTAGDDPEHIRQQVRHTLIHELAHHFGISDDRLRQLGAY